MTSTHRSSDNSTVTVSPTGIVLANYRKSFLYYTDETWASEPPSRFSVSYLGTLGPAIQGICMDINPYKFLSPWSDYEFATAALQPPSQPQDLSSPTRSLSQYPNPIKPLASPGLGVPAASGEYKNPLIVVSMAWLTHLTATEISSDPLSPDVATVAYWVERFAPVVERSKANPDQPYYVVLANRCGVEKSVCYAGSSTVVKISAGEISLFETCGRGEEKVCVIDLGSAPKFSVRSGR